MNAFSRGMEVVGRAAIHFSVEPILFGFGVLALWLHKQIQISEIGHTSLHGAYDKLPGAERFRSERFRWDVPIDEESWHHAHNIRHHGSTNIPGKDADIHFGPVRLTEGTPVRWYHRFQLPITLFVLFPYFTFWMNTHVTGLVDLWGENGIETKYDFLPDRSPASRRLAWKRALRKFLPHYGKEYILFPALAGAFFWKVMLGNFLAARLRDLYSAASIFCGHVGDDIASYPMGTRPRHRGEWYAMQVEATNDFAVPWAVSVLCGGLDYQIEHHLFPRFPPQRLRQIAPEVRAICEAHGVRYKTASWGATLRKAFRHIRELSYATPGGPVAGAHALLREMT